VELQPDGIGREPHAGEAGPLARACPP
jgi:hypothetical protein